MNMEETIQEYIDELEEDKAYLINEISGTIIYEELLQFGARLAEVDKSIIILKGFLNK